MVRNGKSPSRLIEYLYKKVGPHYYQRVDIRFPEAARNTIIDRVRNYSKKAIDNVQISDIDTTDGFRFNLVDNTWLLIRFSGTEPLLRICVETDSTERVTRLLEIGKKMAGV